MSTRSASLVELARRVGVRGTSRVRSGSAADYQLFFEGGYRLVNVVPALLRRHVGLADAKAVIDALADVGRALVHVPMVENEAALLAELQDCGIEAKLLPPGDLNGKHLLHRQGATTE